MNEWRAWEAEKPTTEVGPPVPRTTTPGLHQRRTVETKTLRRELRGTGRTCGCGRLVAQAAYLRTEYRGEENGDALPVHVLKCPCGRTHRVG